MEKYLATIADYQGRAARYAYAARASRDLIKDPATAFAEFTYYSERSAYYAQQAQEMVWELLNK